MKFKLSHLVTVLCLVAIGAQTAAAAFFDVARSNSHYVAITYLSENGIVGGYPDNSFKPDQVVNRAEALKIILEGSQSELETTIKQLTETVFSDISPTAWFSPYILTAQSLGVVSGNPDGTFAPEREVSRAEFLKMLLNTNGFNPEKWVGVQIFPDVPVGSWFEPYMNYAGQAGLVTKDAQGNVKPGEALSRGEVAEMMYRLNVILRATDTAFLMAQAEKQMAQIDIYIANKDLASAKNASELSVDMTQQGYKNLPEDRTVLGSAKLARAYDFLVNAHLANTRQQYDEARDWANQAITKAAEAWEVNSNIQSTARHIKTLATELIGRLPAPSSATIQ